MMDDNFSNLLDGARQYFQGLPKASPSEDGNKNEMGTMAQPTWPSTNIDCSPRSRLQDASQPPSAIAPQPPEPPEPPERPPSDLLIEPEPHIIHKATVMQQAQQKQQSFLNSSCDLERPSSANMISPPTHIIHKPPRLIQDSQSDSSRHNTKEEPPRIPPHFAVTDGINYSQANSIVSSHQQPVQNKYSSHLPTPPQPSIHNSMHYHNRSQNPTQQRSLTVLQSRQTRLPYTNRPYTNELQNISNSSSVNTNSNSSSISVKNSIGSSPTLNTYAHQSYDMSASTIMDGKRGPSASDMYIKPTHNSKQISLPNSLPQKQMSTEIPNHYSRPVGYSYHQSPINHQIVDVDKSGNASGFKAYAQAVQLQQKSRALPTPKSPSVHQTQMVSSPRQYSYSQKVVAQHQQTTPYYSQPQYRSMKMSHHEPIACSKTTVPHNYDYSTHMANKISNSELKPKSVSSYQERPVPLEQRHNSVSSVATAQMIPSSRGATHVPSVDYANHFTRGPSTSHSLKIASESHVSPLKPHQSSSQLYNSSVVNQYPNINSHVDHSNLSKSSAASNYYAQTSYQSTSVVKHSYDMSPKHVNAARTLTTKQNLVTHQPRMTVSVTSLVNQMNARQTSRHEQTIPLVTKQKKESPLDLSVKTVRIPADSTAQDDTENISYDKRDTMLQHNNVHNNREPHNFPHTMLPSRQRLQQKPNNISSSHKVNFLPNFNTNAVDKVSQFHEANQQQYIQSKKVHYDQSYPKNNVMMSHQYVKSIPRSDTQEHMKRYESVNHVYGSHNYSHHIDTNVPKIDLTVSADDHGSNDRRNSQIVHMKDDNRKRDANLVPNSIPSKVARYDMYNYDRHGRLDLAHNKNIPVSNHHYKIANGNNFVPVENSHYDKNMYKKNESLEQQYSKYMPYMHSHHQNDGYYPNYQKSQSVQQNYDYNSSDRNNSDRSGLKPASNVSYPSLHSQYSTTPAKKEVLSILRTSLEARNFVDKNVDNSEECIVINSDDNSEYNDIRPKKLRNSESKSSPKPPSPIVHYDSNAYKVHMPKAVDSIKYESDPFSKSIRVRDDLKNSTEVNQVELFDEKSNEKSSELDAARIRTKAELKGFTQSNNKINESNRSDLLSSNFNNNIINNIEHHKRKLFGKVNNCKDPVKVLDGHINNKLPLDIRNSSDSVFDFQDSGSDCETSIKVNNKTEPVDSASTVRTGTKVENTPDDDFWTKTCDDFMEELKTGKVKKVRKKRGRNILNIEKVSDNNNKSLNSIQIEKTPVVNVVDIKNEIFLMDKIKKNNAYSTTDSSDEDQPLINKKVKKERQNMLKNGSYVENLNKKVDKKIDGSPKKKLKSKTLQDLKNTSKMQLSSDDEDLSLKKIKEKSCKQEPLSDHNGSETESDDMTIANRIKKGSLVISHNETKISDTLLSKETVKVKDETFSVKKTGFGDGSDFRPGWQEEVYNYKISLRMPASLINVTRPPHWPRISSSLPDLDPYPHSPAPSTSTEELFTQRMTDKIKQEVDSDTESTSSYYYLNRKSNYDSEASCSTIISTASKNIKTESASIVDVLMQKCGKKEVKKGRNKIDSNNSPKLIPKSENAIELLPTPSLEVDKEQSKNGSKILDEKLKRDRNYVESFRQETVTTFRDAFVPFGLKSKTRTETRVMKQRVSIKEVFGDERPASAPPIACREEQPAKQKSDDLKQKASLKKNKKKFCVSMMREGLRSARLLKRSDAKGRLLRIRKRNNYLKALSSARMKNSKKETCSVSNSENRIKNREDGVNRPSTSDKKVLKRLFSRRKLSSGFDYIRKKKKQIRKNENTIRRSALPKSHPESIYDVHKEIKGWIIKKSVGETALHRATRLGYTDCVAYCLEKLNMSPSVRDYAGYTPLHVASSLGHLDIARLLLQYGADASETGTGGVRPLHEACENNYVEIVRLLLSYGADPFLETYSGLTPLCKSIGKSKKLLRLHIKDILGHTDSKPWQFRGPCDLFDLLETGYDPLSPAAPSPCSPPPPSSLEIVTSSYSLPPLYRLKPSNNSASSDNLNQDTGLWCLLQDLASLLQIKSRDALLKQIHCGPGPPRDSLKELRMQEFLDRAQCQQLMSTGEKINIRASRIALVKYTDKVKQLLDIELISVR